MSTKKNKKVKNLDKIATKLELVHNKEENKFVLDVPLVHENDLPKVSVTTITRNRKHLFAMAVYNWNNFIYPRDKLEWVIVDDSESPDQDLSEFIKEDTHVKYIKTDPNFFLNKENNTQFMDLGKKRNYAIENSTGDYIVIMDDDDYYFPDSIMAKMRILLHYKLPCGFSIPYGVYHANRKFSHIVGSSKISNGQLPEASLFFKKEFWESQKFKHYRHSQKGKNVQLGESYGLIHDREKKLINIPFWINFIAITHNKNFTGNLRQYYIEEGNTSRANFYDIWNKDVQQIVDRDFGN